MYSVYRFSCRSERSCITWGRLSIWQIFFHVSSSICLFSLVLLTQVERFASRMAKYQDNEDKMTEDYSRAKIEAEKAKEKLERVGLVRSSSLWQWLARILFSLPDFFPAIYAASLRSKVGGFVVLFFAYVDFFSDIKRVQYLVGSFDYYSSVFSIYSVCNHLSY